jgi:glycosyltransferase involved in cell wall biosynthesis
MARSAVVGSGFMSDRLAGAANSTHEVSIVIPVYQGEKTLSALVAEIVPLTSATTTPDGHVFRVVEVLMVYDNGPDDSACVIRELAGLHSFIRPIWLSKNFGQHAATLAGMASSGGEWIVTMDEDGQHNPADIAIMLDTAMRESSVVVYAKPVNAAPHGVLRNTASRCAKWLLSKLVSAPEALNYHSFRLILGSVGRGVAAYSGAGVYLDVAIGWVVDRTATAPVTLRRGGERASGYSGRSLVGHFRRMVLTSGTRGLRLVSFLGATFLVGAVVIAVLLIVARANGSVETPGWTSTIVVVLFSSGATLFSLGIIAEYIGINVNMAMGKPPYLITSDKADGPLGRARNSD